MKRSYLIHKLAVMAVAFFAIAFCACDRTACSDYGDDETEMLDKLGQSLKHKDEYQHLREERIAKLRNVIATTSDDDTKFEVYAQMFDEYSSYCYDSAIVYARRELALAEKIGEPVYIVDAKCDVAFSLISAGITLEALKVLNSVDPSTLPPVSKKNFYYTLAKFWREEADHLRDRSYYQEYIDKSNVFIDSVRALLPKHSPEWYNVTGSKLMRQGKFHEAIKSFNKFLACEDVTAHDRAMAYAELGWAYTYLKDENMTLKCFAQSAIYDNESATREITALYLVAKHCMLHNDYERAYHYLQEALNQVTFFNTRQRLIELTEIMPQVEQERYQAINTRHIALIVAVILATLLLLVLLLFAINVKKKNTLLSVAEESERANLMALEEMNHLLVEASKAKNEYIGTSFYLNSEYISKLEKVYKAINRQITARQYDKLADTVDMKKLEDERQQMYNVFDRTFLGLFPNFVREYNNLFEEKERRYPEEENSLTSEMRIFALMRLGITDSERISKFLDYSVHTVNTYKTRIKNRSFVDNEKFEQMIMEIS